MRLQILYLYRSFYLSKLFNYFLRKGKKEKLEILFFKICKEFDYCLFYEIFYFLKVPFKLFPKKKRLGRHFFVYSNNLVIIGVNEQYFKSAFYFFFFLRKLNLESNLYFNYKILYEVFSIISSGRNSNFFNIALKKKKEAIYLKGLQHYR